MRRRLLLGATVAPLLGGCGFALRRPPPLAFSRIALSGFAPRSPLAEALKRSLAGAAEVVEAPAQAQVVLQALREGRERAVAASTAAGQVRELQLRARLSWRLVTPGGRELLGPSEIAQARDMNYSESTALARSYEEESLYRVMEADIAAQVLRRLEAVREV